MALPVRTDSPSFSRRILPDIPCSALASLGLGGMPTTIAPAANLNMSKYTVGAPLPPPPAEKKIKLDVFDFDAIEKATGAERKRLVTDFGKSLEKNKFVAVKAENIAPIVKGAQGEIAKFFAMSSEEKEKNCHNNNGQSGYVREGLETAQGETIPDHKATYNIPPGFKKWPENCPDFRTALSLCHIELSVYGKQTLKYFSEYLEESTEDPELSVSSALNLLRCCYYPAINEAELINKYGREEAKKIVIQGARKHTDLNAFTLMPKPDQPGLRMPVDIDPNDASKGQEMALVEAPEGCIIINTGEQVELLTAGRFKAGPHEVIVPQENRHLPRHSIVEFISFSKGFNLSPLPGCAKLMTKGMSSEEADAYLKKFPHVNAQQFLDARLIEIGLWESPPKAYVQELLGYGLIPKPNAKAKAMLDKLLA